MLDDDRPALFDIVYPWYVSCSAARLDRRACSRSSGRLLIHRWLALPLALLGDLSELDECCPASSLDKLDCSPMEPKGKLPMMFGQDIVKDGQLTRESCT